MPNHSRRFSNLVPTASLWFIYFVIHWIILAIAGRRYECGSVWFSHSWPLHTLLNFPKFVSDGRRASAHPRAAHPPDAPYQQSYYWLDGSIVAGSSWHFIFAVMSSGECVTLQPVATIHHLPKPYAIEINKFYCLVDWYLLVLSLSTPVII